jgi:hypothetical protein
MNRREDRWVLIGLIGLSCATGLMLFLVSVFDGGILGG